ncbi:MAG: putative LPS assembly protein LptD, partial [Gemmatimonadota bacterium]|nr:putative LPS assembly protein LptD [Gemmatimonadota bacterium]
MRHGPWRRAAAPLFALCLLLAAGLPAAVSAQRPRPAPQPAAPRPPGQDPSGRLGDPRRANPDSAATRVQLVDWAPDDSVMRALLARQGYTVVRYQAREAGFATVGRTMTLVGTDSARAAVQRDSTLLVADSIQFNDSTQVISAHGDTIVMRDPGRGDDVVGRTLMTYDLERREGRTRDFSTIANSGADWRVAAHRATFETDSAGGTSTVYGRDGLITSCLDSVPHYHFLAKELKRVGGSVIVARPAILYVQGVPVMWLPFIFQDIREGRRSGMLTPRVGFAELVRNSPTYRRTAENLGYYFAISDYVDAQIALDWRSSARSTAQDPGWTRLNGEVRYRWLDRFITGSIALSQSNLSSGSRNTAVSLTHNQEFSSRTRLTTNLNYVTSTQVQRQTIINPLAAVATIASQLNVVRSQGPFSINVGGTRRQYPGRDQVDQDFPSLNIASKPLEIGNWFVSSPSFQFASRQSLNLDAAGDFAWRYTDVGGVLDSTRLKRDTRATTFALGTPFKIFDFQVQSGFRFSENLNDFPEIRTIVDPVDTTKRVDRVYQRTFLSTADFDVSIGLPQFLQGTWNVSPSITASNVDPSGYLVRSERTGGA